MIAPRFGEEEKQPVSAISRTLIESRQILRGLWREAYVEKTAGTREMLEKLRTQEDLSWLEAAHRALRFLHDNGCESPYAQLLICAVTVDLIEEEHGGK